jgi:hypothetical protein
VDAFALSVRLFGLRFCRHICHGEKGFCFGMSRVLKDRPTSILPPADWGVKTLSGALLGGLKITTAEAGVQ